MGAVQSKTRTRRSRRYSSLRKRQGPEGSNDPGSPSQETTNPWHRAFDDMYLTRQHADHTYHPEKSCKYCQLSDGCHNTSGKRDAPKAADDSLGGWLAGIRVRTEDKSLPKEYMGHPGLKVKLPPTPTGCRRCNVNQKSKSLPATTTRPELSKLSKDEQEWTITLYEIDKMSGRVPREDMLRLISSIYDAVDTKVGESPHGRKTVRVRLSVTPEPRHSTRLQTTPSGHDPAVAGKTDGACQCTDRPKTEPPARRTQSQRVRRHRSDVSPERLQEKFQPRDIPQQKLVSESKQQQASRDRSKPVRSALDETRDRRWHYAKLEGVEYVNSSRGAKRDPEVYRRNGDSQTKSATPDASKGEEDTRTGKAVNASKRRIRNYNSVDHRNVMLRTRKKDPRFASPYDQHFQEAMYLRLRELQRKGAYEARRANGQRGESDEADEDSCDETDDKKKKQYDGYDVDSETKKRHRIDSDDEESLLKEQSSANSTDRTAVVERDSSKAAVDQTSRLDPKISSSEAQVASIHHHHHYHHGVLASSVVAALCSASPKLDGETHPGGVNQVHTIPPHSSNEPNALDLQSNSTSKHPHSLHHHHHHYHHSTQP